MTNIKELQAQVKALKEYQAIGEEQIRQLEIELEQAIEAEKSWPQEGDECYWVTTDGIVRKFHWYGRYYDIDARLIGNCYRTKEEAEFEIERRKVMTELKKFARDFVAGENNYYIKWDFGVSDFCIDLGVFHKCDSLYFESEEKAWEAINAVGEDRVKKYILGVTD